MTTEQGSIHCPSEPTEGFWLVTAKFPCGVLTMDEADTIAESWRVRGASEATVEHVDQ